MQEIELKILNINKQEVEQKILLLGGKKIFDGKVLSKSLDNAEKLMSAHKNMIRFRTMGDKNYMTYKENRREEDGVKVADEYEVEVSNGKTMEIILEKIGYTTIRQQREKIRTSYKLGEARFDIDQYPTIPVYMEIEGTKDSIAKALKQLGYTMEDTCTLTATEVLKQYGQDPNIQTFEK